MQIALELCSTYQKHLLVYSGILVYMNYTKLHWAITLHVEVIWKLYHYKHSKVLFSIGHWKKGKYISSYTVNYLRLTIKENL